MTRSLQDLQGRTESVDGRPAAVLDPAGTAILRAHYLRTLTADDNDHTVE